MIMTNQVSIQDVIFFPQMKPEKKPEISSKQDYIDQGIREELVPILEKLGIQTSSWSRYTRSLLYPEQFYIVKKHGFCYIRHYD